MDWGDGSAIQSITSYTPSYISHQYASVARTYEITLSQTNPWGLVRVTKKVNLPYQTQTIQNPKGTAYFVSNTGNWSGTPVSYNYIFSGDAVNTVDAIPNPFDKSLFCIVRLIFNKFKNRCGDTGLGDN